MGSSIQWVASSTRCREIDRLSVSEYGRTDDELIQAAAGSVVDAIAIKYPKARRVLVLCGKGRNGADGLVAARMLAEQGLEVECIVYGTDEDVAPNVGYMDAARSMLGLTMKQEWPPQLRTPESTAPDLIVDAIFGTGFTGAVRQPYVNAIRNTSISGVPVVSVDVPSGIDADTGDALDERSHVHADLTVTFGLPKPFLFQGRGVEASGEWIVADIGFPAELLGKATARQTWSLAESGEVFRTKLRRPVNSNKGSTGHVMIVAGSAHMRGAAVLAAMGALRAGAGLVSVASVPEVLDAVANHLPETILVPLASSAGSIHLDAGSMDRLFRRKFDAAVVGPGFTTNAVAVKSLRALFKRVEVPLCVDADALNIVAGGVGLSDVPCVITPHPGEAARLLGAQTDEIQMDRFGSCSRLAAQTNSTVILKGAYSLVGTLHQPLRVNLTGNSGMACAGMGDVLSGVVGTLLAQLDDPFLAATLAASWHGAAGDLCVSEIGPVGFTASELATRLPMVRAKLMSCDDPSR